MAFGAVGDAIRAGEGGRLPASRSPYDDLPDGVVVAEPDTAAGGALVVRDVNAAARRLLRGPVGRTARPGGQRPTPSGDLRSSTDSLSDLTADAPSAAAPDPAPSAALADVLPLRTSHGDDWWSCTARALSMPRVKGLPERLLHLPGTDGREDVELLVTAACHRGADGRLVRLVVCLRDAGARERHDRDRADLVSTVAHELRSPLTSVKGFTATLLAKWERFNDEQKRLMLATVNADADRVTRLLGELLDVSRIESGRLVLHRQVVDVPDRVRRTVAGRVAAGEPPERFVVTVDGALPDMWLDPDKLDQVLGNLVENALRHGAGTVTVAVTGRPDGLLLEVSDEGEGIPHEHLGRIFARFWRGNERRGGTGLGLYITKGIVEAFGGAIGVDRGPAGGARFRIELPAGSPSYEG